MRRGTKGSLPRSKRARAKRKQLRLDHIDAKCYIRRGNAYNRAMKLYGKEATVYVINCMYYAGIKSNNDYLNGLESKR